MDRRPLLPGAVVVMLAIALAIYLIEKIGQAVLAISNVILLVALAWILTLMLRPAVNWIHGLTVPEALARVEQALSDAMLTDRLEVRLIHGRSGGRIRAALHRRLAEIPSVRAFRVDRHNPGVTIVVL